MKTRVVDLRSSASVVQPFEYDDVIEVIATNDTVVKFSGPQLNAVAFVMAMRTGGDRPSTIEGIKHIRALSSWGLFQSKIAIDALISLKMVKE